MTETVFTLLGHDQGVPHDIVMSMAQDAAGFVWFGTQGGLARYDGYHFKVYKGDPEDPTTLPDNFIPALLPAEGGGLWIGTSANGLARFEPATERFTRYAVGPDGISGGVIHALAQDHHGGLWIASSGGLDRLDIASGRFTHVPVLADGAGQHEAVGLSVLIDRAETIWIGTAAGLFRRPSGQDRFLSVTIGTPAPAVQALHEDSAGRIWFGTARSGGGRVEADGGGLRALVDDTGQVTDLAKLDLRDIADPRPDLHWLAAFGVGILEVDDELHVRHRIHHDPLVPASLPANELRRLLIDRSGLVWVGSNRAIGVFDPLARAVSTVFASRLTVDGKTCTDVSAVAAPVAGPVWLGCANEGVALVDPEAGGIKLLAADADHPDQALPRRAILALTEPAGGAGMWIGTAGGLYRAGPDGKGLAHVMLPGRDIQPTITALLAERNNLWVATLSSGLLHFDAAGPALNAIGPATLSDTRLTSLMPSHDDRLWVGSLDGLGLFNPGDGEVERIRPEPGNPTALHVHFVSTLTTDLQGRLWVGTLGGGIGVMVGRDASGKPQFRRISLKQGMPNENIGSLLRDRRGRIWASLADGVAMIDPDTLAVRPIGRSDGLSINAYWSGSGAVTAAGELLFGGAGGLSVIRPDLLSEWDFHPPLVITEAMIGKQKITAAQIAGHDAEHPILVAPDANSIAVEFSALDYSAPARNHYGYRLDGVDSDWVETDGDHRMASYSNLAPGDYALHLRGSNRNGAWTEATLTIPLRVLPAWYQTLWFRTIQVLAALLLLVGLVQARTALLRAQRRALERQVAERTIELSDKQGQLQQANLALSQSNDALALSVETLRKLGEVGRDITTHLDTEAVFGALHRHCQALLDGPAFSIFLLTPDRCRLVLRYGVEDGVAIPQSERDLNDPHSMAARAARENAELTAQFPGHDNPGHVPGTRHMLSGLYAPMAIGDRVLGVMTIQSDRENAYGEREKLIFRSLSAYGAIALANANSLEALQSAQARLEQIAYLDPLTNLPNRRMFTQEFRKLRAASERQGKRFALLLIDLDRFKQVNDDLGHEAGDRILIEAGLRLQAGLRETDSIARLGGDEFAILLSGARDLSGIEIVCRRIMTSFSRPIPFNGRELTATLSIGVAIFPIHGETQEELYRSADQALYDAKRAGRNTWQEYQPAYQ